MKCITKPIHIERLDRRLLLAATPVLVKELSLGTRASNPYEYEEVGGTVFFIASENPFTHDDLWKSDGTPAGTVRVKEFGPPTRPDDRLRDLTAMGGRLYFSAPDVKAAHRKATELGAQTVFEPQDFPGGEFAIVTDPQGASIGLLKTSQ